MSSFLVEFEFISKTFQALRDFYSVLVVGSVHFCAKVFKFYRAILFPMSLRRIIGTDIATERAPICAFDVCLGALVAPLAPAVGVLKEIAYGLLRH